MPKYLVAKLCGTQLEMSVVRMETPYLPVICSMPEAEGMMGNFE